jgi:uncharacterized membrane protein YcaP (DUF421 family)
LLGWFSRFQTRIDGTQQIQKLKLMKKNLSILLASLVIAGAVSLTVPFLHAQPANNPTPKPPVIEATPAMHAALKDLQNARETLMQARKAFGGCA